MGFQVLKYDNLNHDEFHNALNEFAKKSYQKINEKNIENEIKNKLLSVEFRENLFELIFDKLSVQYDINLVSKVLRNLKIDISENFSSSIISKDKNYLDDILTSNMIDNINQKQYSRDKTKYIINGNGIRLPKNRFVLEFVRNYLNQKALTFRELKNIFLDEYQGSTGVINQLEVVERKYLNKADKRHFMNYNEILTSSDEIKFVVSTQWKLDNVQNILKLAKREGFKIDEVK